MYRTHQSIPLSKREQHTLWISLCRTIYMRSYVFQCNRSIIYSFIHLLDMWNKALWQCITEHLSSKAGNVLMLLCESLLQATSFGRNESSGPKYLQFVLKYCVIRKFLSFVFGTQFQREGKGLGREEERIAEWAKSCCVAFCSCNRVGHWKHLV